MLDELGPDDDDFAINVASLVAKETSLSGTRNCGRLRVASIGRFLIPVYANA